MQIDGENMKYYFSNYDKYMKMPKIVYHYCSIQTFLDIISNSTIRLSNIVKSNDNEEIRYIIPFVEKAILKAVQEYNFFASDDFKISGDSVMESLERSFNELSATFYVTCFSEVVDLVDQWARYADHAKGVAIGFSTDEFVKLQTTPYVGYWFSSIVYDANHIIQRMVEIITKSYEKRCKYNDELHNFITMTDIINKLILTMLHHAPLYKNHAFSQEREWRLVYNPFGRLRRIHNKFAYFDKINETNSYCSYESKISRKEIAYKVIEEGKQLTSYIDLNFDTIKGNLIREIIIGNQSKLTSSDMDLVSFLKSMGYNISNIGLSDTITISKSHIPYNK